MHSVTETQASFVKGAKGKTSLFFIQILPVGVASCLLLIDLHQNRDRKHFTRTKQMEEQTDHIVSN